MDRVALLVSRRQDFVVFVERRVRDRAVAEDLVQSVLERALPRVASVQADHAVLAWFYRSLRNAIVDHQRHEAVVSRALEGEPPPPAAERTNACRCVLGLAKQLKPEYADALDRVEIEGESVKAFAASRRISSANAAVRVFRARQALRREVRRTCGACAEGGCLDCTCGL